MYKILFTLDYEIHGNGDGSPMELMVAPTWKLIKQLEKYDAKLTIMADVAEIIKFVEYKEEYGVDKFYSNEINEQLKYAVANGHDVQLHIHSSYLKSKNNSGWEQNWEEYNLAALPYKRINEIVFQCKTYLEELLTPINNNYNCNVFRAANWSMHPTKNIVRALINNNIAIDTSVYKYGKGSGNVFYDYTDSYSSFLPWFIDINNICYKDNMGKLLEVPIYSVEKPIISFITPSRIFRIIRSQFHKHKLSKEEKNKTNIRSTDSNTKKRFYNKFLKKYPWKLDFSQAMGKQLIKSIKNISTKNLHDIDIPIVLIGHSKTYNWFNKRSLDLLLKYIDQNKNIYRFSLFKDIDNESFRNIK